jgi:hypothetical protein
MAAIPVQVFITSFAEKGQAEAAAWSCSKAVDAIGVANRIWKAADVQFGSKECKVDTPLDVAKDARGNDQRILDTLSYRRPATGVVNIFLVNAIPNLNAGGSSYLDSDPEPACFVQWYGETEANGRALAHELGHLLGLDHLEVGYSNEQRAAKQIHNLMVKGLATGTELSADQIKTARGSKLAKRFGG